MAVRSFVFDAYGTLYDVQSVLRTVERACPGRGDFVTQLWRLKQLEYTWLRTAMDAFEDFEVVTRDGLAYALRVAGIELDPVARREVEDAYLHLELAPNAERVLVELAGRTKSILSNGSLNMLTELVRRSGLRPLLKHVISVDGARAYKPSPKAYALVEAVTGIAPAETLFVSSNGFDVAGAKRAGFEVAWVRRGGAFEAVPDIVTPRYMFDAQRLGEEELGYRADHVLDDLAQVLSFA